MSIWGTRCLLIALLLAGALPLAAQNTEPVEPDAEVSDAAIEVRLEDIFREIPSLTGVEVSVQAGVVRLAGTTADLEAARRAEVLAEKLAGVITIENAIERDASVRNQIAPAWVESRALLGNLVAILPLLALALGLFVAVVLLGGLLARRRGFWERITPNPFIAELAATTVRVVFVIVGLVLALNLVGANALLGAVLGSAGLIGLAVGFAVRDTIENYVASIMLSLRQPFRPRDLVAINDKEGLVIRLTSRATVLMTLDGNHLRIPNAEVFKAHILNFTTNPERRFSFELGVAADDDPLAAISTGVDVLQSLPFVLQEPAPLGMVQAVGDSNILLEFAAWINQRDSDFVKSRSRALAGVKTALEEAGFELPEPIYRLRLEGSAAAGLEARSATAPEQEREKRSPRSASLDVTPDTRIDEKVEKERREGEGEDLLSDAAPKE